MNKRSLSIASIVLMVAVLAHGGATRAAAASPAKWKVVIPQVSAADPGRMLNLAGTPERLVPGLGGYVYDDAESAIEVYATIGMMSGGTYWTIFRTWVHFPEQVEISGVAPFALQTDPLLPLTSPCFPDGSTHWYEFLNGVHPYDSHYLVDIVFAGPYVNSRSEADWEIKPVGWKIPGHVTLSIMPEAFTSNDCHLYLSDHHDIFVRSHQAWLIKVSPTMYRVEMTADFSDPSRLFGDSPWSLNNAKDFILHRFCDCTTRVSRKTTYEVMEYHYPELGYAPFNIEMLYIKN